MYKEIYIYICTYIFIYYGPCSPYIDPLAFWSMFATESSGLLGVSFHHVLFDIFGLAALLRQLHQELEPGWDQVVNVLVMN